MKEGERHERCFSAHNANWFTCADFTPLRNSVERSGDQSREPRLTRIASVVKFAVFFSPEEPRPCLLVRTGERFVSGGSRSLWEAE